MKFIFDLLMLAGLKRAFNLFYSVAMTHFLVFYIRVIERCRKVFTSLIVLFLCIIVMFGGFLILHAALFIYLPFDSEIKALIFLILGCCYFFIPMALILCLNSQRSWLKMCGVEEILKNIASKKEKQ